MSTIGIDFGNESCAVAVAQNRSINMLLTEESKYETPTIVCFGNKQRFFGAAGAFSAMTNPNNAISQIKRLVGRKLSDPYLQHDLQHFPFSVTDGPDGFPLIHVTYSGEQHTFTPTQVLAMVLAHLKKLAERNLSGTIGDCCIGVPVFFTDIQKRAVLDAAKIAELNAPRLIHEMTAVALGYRIHKTDLSKSDKLNVAFVDVGHASMQVCIAEYKSQYLKVLSHAFDQSLGGRDFDNALFEHFAAKFEKEHNVDVSQNVRACARLMSACEKTKKVLSANPAAHINIECLMNEKDMNYEIKREEFEDISKPILRRVVATLKKACEIAQLYGQSIHEVELVGSGSRVPAITGILKNFFKKEPRRTMNSSECVARGCALHCASLSPTFKGWELKDLEHIYGGLSSLDIQNALEKEYDMACNDKVVLETKERKNALEAYVYKIREQLYGKYQDFVEEKERESVDHKLQETEDWLYNEGEDEDKDAYVAKLEELINLATPIEVRYEEDLHRQDAINHLVQCLNYCKGICSGDHIDPAKMNEVSIKSSSVEQWLNATIEQQIQLPKHANPVLLCENLKNRADELRSFCYQIMPKPKPQPNSQPTKMASTLISRADLEEDAMTFQDKRTEETKEARKALEAFVLTTIKELNGKYRDFVAPLVENLLITILRETEQWLYKEGKDQDKPIYLSKLGKLKRLSDPIEARYKEDQHRETSISCLAHWIQYYKEITCSADQCWDHIDPMEKKKVVDVCNEAEQWLNDSNLKQEYLPKYADPVLICDDLNNTTDYIISYCEPIMFKPKPENFHRCGRNMPFFVALI